MTLTQPIAGFIADKKGPRQLNILGGVVAGIGWISTSFIDTPQVLYITYSFGGVGVGTIYATSIGLANKWFPR